MDIEWEDVMEKCAHLATSALPFKLQYVSYPVWVTLCFPKSPFARDELSPFELTLNVKKQYKFEWICLAVDYLHIYLTKDVLIIFHRLTYLGAMLNEIN